MFGTIKNISEIVVSSASGFVVGTVLHSFTPEDVGKFGKIAYKVGVTCIGGAVGAAVAGHWSRVVDDMVVVGTKQQEE